MYMYMYINMYMYMYRESECNPLIVAINSATACWFILSCPSSTRQTRMDNPESCECCFRVSAGAGRISLQGLIRGYVGSLLKCYKAVYREFKGDCMINAIGASDNLGSVVMLS